MKIQQRTYAEEEEEVEINEISLFLSSQEYALAFGERGANVVVNDLGGNPSGDSSHSSQPADEVVKLIQSRGGNAVADYHSVEDGKAIIQTAINNFGRIDILVKKILQSI